jgi:pyruvate, orthophosphate dikinase
MATPEDVVRRLVTPGHIDQMLHPRFSNEGKPDYKHSIVAKGMPASPGAAGA